MTEHVRDVRVLSIPAQHPYTQAIRPAGVAYLPDPDIDGNWWPHPALEAGFWLKPPEADILHIHFGFEHRSPAQIDELARAVPVPLVLTVHDLDNPHLEEQAEHHERLRILVGAADAVLTLTECAARRLRGEFGANDVRVVPHPAVVAEPAAQPREEIAGVFVKSLRSNVVADPEFYLAIGRRVPLRVFAHDVDATRDLRDALRGMVELVVHDPFNDAALHGEVAKLTACILPYTRGTHSGWLEMCRDLGTTVAVPDIGCYAGQVDAPEAVETYALGDPASAAEAACTLIARGPVPYRGDRGRQLGKVRQVHADVYREVLSR
ncbi:glycosyltransferase [Corynebacterium qintianiae]|uniref:glycosyltransferase n=1 Tax=Corynebacterium qintianiae TaxID=2709392 RepID=UPI0013ED548C|nr:glycosyltransferase [Corynebacterium qintianiae]